MKLLHKEIRTCGSTSNQNPRLIEEFQEEGKMEVTG